MLEKGYESTFEHLQWRQIKNAFDVNLVLVPHHYETMEEALASLNGKNIFLIPPGRIESIDMKDYELPKGDVNFIFGRPTDNLTKYVTSDDDVISFYTPKETDLMATTMAGIVLYEYR